MSSWRRKASVLPQLDGDVTLKLYTRLGDRGGLSRPTASSTAKSRTSTLSPLPRRASSTSPNPGSQPGLSKTESRVQPSEFRRAGSLRYPRPSTRSVGESKPLTSSLLPSARRAAPEISKYSPTPARRAAPETKHSLNPVRRAAPETNKYSLNSIRSPTISPFPPTQGTAPEISKYSPNPVRRISPETSKYSPTPARRAAPEISKYSPNPVRRISPETSKYSPSPIRASTRLTHKKDEQGRPPREVSKDIKMASSHKKPEFKVTPQRPPELQKLNSIDNANRSMRDSGFYESSQPSDCSSASTTLERKVPKVEDVLHLPESSNFEEYERIITEKIESLAKEKKVYSEKPAELYICDARNIDDLLGPILEQTIPEDSSASLMLKKENLEDYKKLDDCTLQVYRDRGSDGDYGSYLDLESTLDEQAEELDGFQDNKKNSILLRTQLSVRVHAIIERLVNSSGRELRRALFSLKQIFKDDKDLVHEFVQNDGLTCLVKVGSEADQNYQNYILRALGQVMLYVDGMNGVMAHSETVQWLYSLIASKFRLVVKTALKLLLVFVEYTEANCLLLSAAVRASDGERGAKPWSNIMALLTERDGTDTELLVYAVTLVNKTLSGIPDQDTYYDVVDSLEEQGMAQVIRHYMGRQGADLDLLQQFNIYEAVLKMEDGEGDDDSQPLLGHYKIRQSTRAPHPSFANGDTRRKSRRHSTDSRPTPLNGITVTDHKPAGRKSEPPQRSNLPERTQVNGTATHQGVTNGGITPGLRKRRERDAHNRSLIQEQEANGREVVYYRDNSKPAAAATLPDPQPKAPTGPSLVQRQRSQFESRAEPPQSRADPTKKSWMLSMMYGKSQDDQEVGADGAEEVVVRPQQIRKEANNGATNGHAANFTHAAGIIHRAKEGLAAAAAPRAPATTPPEPCRPAPPIGPRPDSELQWDQLTKSLNRPLIINDLDFTDLKPEDDCDFLVISNGCVADGPPPPPPPPPGGLAPPPPPPVMMPPPPPVRRLAASEQYHTMPASVNGSSKTKKTLKLFWKEVKDDPGLLSRTGRRKTIWDELSPVSLDLQRLEHLFENRAKDVLNKEKTQEVGGGKKNEIIVLDPKRSNAINIGMTKLPPPRTIKTAILKMDSTIMNREGIEKLLSTMLPTEEEKNKITEAQMANPELPLGSAEQLLLTLCSISELEARLRLWAFRLDYDSMEKEVAEPLMDLKQAILEIENNQTFRLVLATLRSVGNFLNGAQAKGFHLEYLAKVPEVKDTVHKHSLLYHLCQMVMERCPGSSDLYSELGAVTRASKADYDEVARSLGRMQADCKASWEFLKAIAKHDGSTSMRVKMSEFLTDCAERIVVLGVIHRRVTNRFNKFLVYLGSGPMKHQQVCKVVSEFALEYRTTRERVVQQMEKRANHRERCKTRGKMIIETFKSKEQVQADQELRQLLAPESRFTKWGTVPAIRTKPTILGANTTNTVPSRQGGGDMTDEEMLESLVRTAQISRSNESRLRKKARYGDRKSLRRTLKNGLGLSEEDQRMLASVVL